MNPWVPLLGALAYNVHRHLTGGSTICSTVRAAVGPRAAATILAGLLAWFVPHLLRGYPRPPKES